MVYVKPKAQEANLLESKKVTRLRVSYWFDRCTEMCAVVMQKCGDDQLVLGANAASISAEFISFKDALSRKTGILMKSKSIARRAGLR